jgi:RNA polymerase sigma factor (sigma-70 family)
MNGDSAGRGLFSRRKSQQQKELQAKVAAFLRRSFGIEDAETIAWESITIANRQADKGGITSSFPGLVTTIAYRRAARTLRRQSNRDVPIDSAPDSALLSPSDPSEEVCCREVYTAFVAILDKQCTKFQRDTFMLQFYDRLSIAEIAERLGTTENCVRVTLAKVRKRMGCSLEVRKLLRQDIDDGGGNGN